MTFRPQFQFCVWEGPREHRPFNLIETRAVIQLEAPGTEINFQTHASVNQEEKQCLAFMFPAATEIRKMSV
jgi:hypothetical protein